MDIASSSIAFLESFLHTKVGRFKHVYSLFKISNYYYCNNIISGYVEVNIRKDIGVEHPMWIAADRSSRLQMQLIKNINLLFVEIMYRFLLYLREQKEFQGSERYSYTPWKPSYYYNEHEILYFRFKIRRKLALQ